MLIVPVVDELPALQGPNSIELKNEFYHYSCRESQLNVDKDNLNKECEKFICNIGVHNDYALPCECKFVFKIFKIKPLSFEIFFINKRSSYWFNKYNMQLDGWSMSMQTKYCQ